MELEQYEQLFPHAQAEGLIWSTPNRQVAWRVETLRTKEPDTFAWLEIMGDGDILYDVGANIGQYTMLAAKRGVRVHAFEPESQNFALLCRNIALNKLSALATPWPLALNNYTGLSLLHIAQLTAGNSCNAFDQAIDFKGERKEFQHTQGCPGYRLDAFALDYKAPTHIKIDVDGFEHLVLEGAQEALKNVTSVLVETNTHLEAHRAIEDFLLRFGLIPDVVTAEKARRTEGPFKGVGNVIYFRDEKDFLSAKEIKNV